MIYGHGKPYLVALIYPNEENKINYNISIQALLFQLNKKMSPEKRVRKFFLLSEPFSTKNNQLTPTLKLKRRIIVKNYYHELENMYINET